ncbi:MAG: FapA family protein, partial [Lachnospiraceae bacterium]|nr:FapA family protein [Lachnospiraceae bacterium]
GRRGFITVVRVAAAHLVQVKTLGSSMGAATVIEVGADPSVKMRMMELQQQVMDKEKELETLKPILENAAKKLSTGIQLRPEQMEFARETLEKEKDLKRERDACLKKLEDLQTILNASNSAKVEVTGEVYGGTRISIADVSTIIKGHTHYCRFIKEAGDVKMVPM